MNLLAHAFLSFHQPEILVGNMISDHVKGKKKFDYAPVIQKGINLHRAIDDFTDSHPATIDAKQYFRSEYRLYSGAFIDIVYDHFLATDKAQFANDQVLSTFVHETYNYLSLYENILPANFRMMLPYMISHNWLYNYQFDKGIQRSFAGMVRRAKYMDDSNPAFIIFKNHYTELEKCYKNFFPSLKDFAEHELQRLLQQ